MEKKVRIYIDLHPGWHDHERPFVQVAANAPMLELSDGNRRFCVEVSLPCFGGSAETERTIYPPRGSVKLTEDRSKPDNRGFSNTDGYQPQQPESRSDG